MRILRNPVRGTAVKAWAVSAGRGAFFRRGRGVAGLVVLLVAAAGCDLVLDTLSDGTIAPAAITEIHVSGGSGDVTIEPDSAVHTADIRRTVRYRGPKPGVTYHIDGTVLTIDTSCTGNCSVSYVVRVPPRGTGTGLIVSGDNGSGDVRITGVGSVDLHLGSGDLQVTDVSGPVTTRTGSGDTTVSGVAGDVSVTTSSGGVNGDDLRGSQVRVDVSSGDVSLGLSGTGNATIRTGSGDIDITVPDHSVSLSLDNGNGDQRIEITPDANSPYHLDLHAGSGDISIKPS
jgi:Putative adhesin